MCFFFFNDTATTEIYTLSLHDALPICLLVARPLAHPERPHRARPDAKMRGEPRPERARSEEHTSELQSPCNLVCRLLLEKKKEVRIVEIVGLDLQADGGTHVTHTREVG